MATVEITHADGSTDTIPGTTAPSDNEPNWSRQRELLAMRRVRINVYREDAQNANLEPKSDRVDFAGDTLRLVDIDKGGSVWRLTCYSYEWDANRTPPTVGGSVYEGTDKEILTDLINDVPGWTVGSIAELTGTLSFVFSHAHIHDAIRRVEKNVPGELLFRDGGTVDYVDRIGSDKSGSIELSGTAGTIEGEIEINDKGREMDGTHIRVLGVHEGEAQLFVNLVPQDDPQSYKNEVRYNAGTRWQDSSDTDWDSFENKDVTSQATLEREAETLADELADGNIEAKATTPDLNIGLGDTVQVVKSDAEIDRPMRIHRITEQVSGATTTLKLLLSTRTRMRTGDADKLRSIRQFNRGFQGSSVVIQAGGFLQPISSSTRATLPFRYPDIKFENNVELQVKGLPYRSYVGAAGHTHGISFSDSAVSENNSNYTQPVSDGSGTSEGSVAAETRENITSTTVSTGGGSTTDAINVSTDISELYAAAAVYIKWEQEAAISNNCEIYLEDESGKQYSGNSYAYTTPIAGGLEHWISYVGIIPRNTKDENIRMYLENSVGENIETYLAHTQWFASGKHTHNISVSGTTISDSAVGFEPGVNLWDGVDQSPELTPDNVDVLVNGTTVASNIGSGEFETTVDLGGDLNPGAWNEIELDADSRGFIQATVSARAYEQIGQQ